MPRRCYLTNSYRGGTTCVLYGYEDGDRVNVDQQGPDTLWVSGFKGPEVEFDVPSLNETAPGEMLSWRAVDPAILPTLRTAGGSF